MDKAWSNLCRVLGNDFAPFLSHVIPPLLKAAEYSLPRLDPSEPFSVRRLRVSDTRLSAISFLEEHDYDLQNTLASTNNTEMEEKVVAFDQLTVYADTMRGALEPWLMPCMDLSLQALSFQHKLVRQVRFCARDRLRLH